MCDAQFKFKLIIAFQAQILSDLAVNYAQSLQEHSVFSKAGGWNRYLLKMKIYFHTV